VINYFRLYKRAKMARRSSSRSKKKPEILSYEHLMACDKIRTCKKKAKQLERARVGMRKLRAKRSKKSKLKIKLKFGKK
jgi:hypothetical protein